MDRGRRLFGAARDPGAELFQFRTIAAQCDAAHPPAISDPHRHATVPEAWKLLDNDTHAFAATVRDDDQASQALFKHLDMTGEWQRIGKVAIHVKGKVDPVDDLYPHVGGLISETDEHVIWNKARLNTDDEVRVRIIESDSADEPTKRVLRDSEEDLEQRKALVRATAKSWGWTLTEPSA